MVRRLKRELPPHFDGTPRFPERKLEPITVTYTDEERAAHGDLARYTELRVEGASRGAERFAAEFVLKLLKKRMFSSPAAFARTLAKHRDSLAKAGTLRASAEASLGVLRQLADRVGESYESEEDYEQAEDEAQGSSGQLFRPLSPEEAKLLDSLASWSEGASTRPDAKATALLDLIEETCRPDGRWGDQRITVFTEYRDTQKWLLDLFASRELTEEEHTELLYGGGARSLERVTARVVDDPRLREPVAVAYARLVVTGADGHRLHEESSRLAALLPRGSSSGLASPRFRSRSTTPAVALCPTQC